MKGLSLDPSFLTLNDEGRTAMQDVEEREQIEETIALAKILALGNRQIEAGQVEPAADVIARLRERRS